MSLAIKKLLDLGAITVCKHSDDQFVSSIFLAPKSNGGKRFILNLKRLNKFIATTHFKMEDHRTAAKLIPKDGYLATIDLKESYLLVPMSEKHRKYLRFQFGQKTYQFNALPYGLSVAPRVFTKIMREVVNHLRHRGFKSVIFLDDLLCVGDSYEECNLNVTETINLLKCLGFVINYDKSVLVPQKECKFLGFMFNTSSMSIYLPIDKKLRILDLVKKHLKLPTCTIREVSQLIGTLTSACPAIKYGWLYTKEIERQKYLALKKSNSYETKVRLPDTILPDLRWWEQNIMNSENSMRPDENFKLEIFSDASRTGWGGYCNGSRVHGSWKQDELVSHINYLELLAVFLSLKCFAKSMSHCSLLLRIDNTTAISYVNRMGGIQFPHLNKLAKDIWQWCEMRRIWLFASYINTKENKEADQESRRLNCDTEWQLSQWAFEHIVDTFGQPEVDLFASRTNAKCSRFVSWKPDPDASAVDAFTICWGTSFFYAFPPFSVILRCLRKIVTDRATGIFVFPYWPGQPWFPLLKKMLASEIIFFQPHVDLLQSYSRSVHPLHQSLTLGAAKLSGLPS